MRKKRIRTSSKLNLFKKKILKIARILILCGASSCSSSGKNTMRNWKIYVHKIQF